MTFVDIHTHFVHNTPEIFSIQHLSPANYKTNLHSISVGIHPWHIDVSKYKQELDELREITQYKNVYAIGECGLDRNIDIPLPLQEEIFTAQLLLAQKVNKPVIIHCVRCFDELVSIKNKLIPTVPLIVHGYNKEVSVTERLLKNGFYLSFGKALLNEGSGAAKAMGLCPAEKFFLETDDAEISIKIIYEKAADIRKISLAELQKQQQINFKKIFSYE